MNNDIQQENEEIIGSNYNVDVSIEKLKEGMLRTLEIIVNNSRDDAMSILDISQRTYYNRLTEYVTKYNIDPRVLYSESVLKKYPELEQYINDDNYYTDQTKTKIKPLSQMLRLPSEDYNEGWRTRSMSVLTGPDGEVKLTWWKRFKDEETFLNEAEKAIDNICKKKVKPISAVKKPVIPKNDLLTFYPLPDLHFGVLICKDEVNHGMNYDLQIAEEWVRSAYNYLIDSAPQSSVAVITDLGDFLHASNDANRTKSGHELDVDQRHSKIVEISFNVAKDVVEKALTKHEIVYIYSVKGNHSELVGLYLKKFLAAYFRNNPRVVIDTSRNQAQQYHRHGKTLLGFSHGHELKPNRAPESIVSDAKAIWSDVDYVYFHFGHIHTDKAYSTPLCKIESHANLIPRDNWAESMGYRGEIGMAKSITYSAEYGEISRNVFNIRMDERVFNYKQHNAQRIVDSSKINTKKIK